MFHLQSKRVYEGERSEYRSVTDFGRAYGAHCFAQYQEQHPVQYWSPNDGYAFCSFPLKARYDTPAALDAAAEELWDIQRFLTEQTPAVTEKYVFTFQSPICDPMRFYDSLGSGTLTFRTDDEEAEEKRGRACALVESKNRPRELFLHFTWFRQITIQSSVIMDIADEKGRFDMLPCSQNCSRHCLNCHKACGNSSGSSKKPV